MPTRRDDLRRADLIRHRLPSRGACVIDPSFTRPTVREVEVIVIVIVVHAAIVALLALGLAVPTVAGALGLATLTSTELVRRLTRTAQFVVG